MSDVRYDDMNVKKPNLEPQISIALAKPFTVSTEIKENLSYIIQ